MKNALLVVVLIFLSVNVGVIYYVVLGDLGHFEKKLAVVENQVGALVQGGAATEPDVVKDGSLVVLSDQQENALVKKISFLLEEKYGLSPQVLGAQDLASGEASVFYVPLGSASVDSTGNQWRDVAMEVVLNTDDYGVITELLFEAGLSAPDDNGKVEARLRDVGSGALAGSEIVGEGKSSNFVHSLPLRILPGNRVVKVQMKTDGIEGKIENARLKIRRASNSYTSDGISGN